MIEVNGWLIEQFFRPIFRRFSKHGGGVYFDKELFPITQTLESKYWVIRDEFEDLRWRIKDFAPFQDISPDQIYISNDDKWKMFFLKLSRAWSGGRRKWPSDTYRTHHCSGFLRRIVAPSTASWERGRAQSARARAL